MVENKDLCFITGFIIVILASFGQEAKTKLFVRAILIRFGFPFLLLCVYALKLIADSVHTSVIDDQTRRKKKYLKLQ